VLHLVVTLRGHALELTLGRQADDPEEEEYEDPVVATGSMHGAETDQPRLGFVLPANSED
jgi:hypothetical protein